MKSWMASCLVGRSNPCVTWLLIVCVACGWGSSGSINAEPLLHSVPAIKVVVSTHPLARVVNSIASTREVERATLLEAGVTPHDASLRPRQLQALLAADLVIWMGPEVEPYLASWIRKRTTATLDISALADIQRLPARGHAKHGHGHTHEAHFDIHLWWSRHNLQVAGNAIAERLSALQPAFEPVFTTRQHQFREALTLLAQAFPSSGAKMPAFAVFHDGWQYLERDLGQSAAAGFVMDGELAMGVRHLAALQERFKTSPVQCVLLEPGMNTALVTKLLPGTPTVTLDPMGWDAPGHDAVDMLRNAYERLQKCGTR